jgi:hypothetical protein
MLIKISCSTFHTVDNKVYCIVLKLTVPTVDCKMLNTQKFQEGNKDYSYVLLFLKVFFLYEN